MKKVLFIRRDLEYFHRYKLGFARRHFNKKLIFDKRVVWFWNHFFKLDYLTFRKKLVKIAQESISYNNFDLIILYEDKKIIESLSEGTLLFPIDEDDWISPFLSEELDKVLVQKNICWDVYYIHSNGEKIYYNSNKYNIFPSCSYAMRLPCDFEKIICHWEVKRENIHNISKCLAVKIDSPASVTSMKDSVNFKKAIKITYDTMSFPDNLPKEFLPYWKKYKELCQELLDSANFPIN